MIATSWEPVFLVVEVARGTALTLTLTDSELGKLEHRHEPISYAPLPNTRFPFTCRAVDTEADRQARAAAAEAVRTSELVRCID